MRRVRHRRGFHLRAAIIELDRRELADPVLFATGEGRGGGSGRVGPNRILRMPNAEDVRRSSRRRGRRGREDCRTNVVVEGELSNVRTGAGKADGGALLEASKGLVGAVAVGGL